MGSTTREGFPKDQGLLLSLTCACGSEVPRVLATILRMALSLTFATPPTSATVGQYNVEPSESSTSYSRSALIAESKPSSLRRSFAETTNAYLMSLDFVLRTIACNSSLATRLACFCPFRASAARIRHGLHELPGTDRSGHTGDGASFCLAEHGRRLTRVAGRRPADPGRDGERARGTVCVTIGTALVVACARGGEAQVDLDAIIPQMVCAYPDGLDLRPLRNRYAKRANRHHRPN